MKADVTRLERIRIQKKAAPASRGSVLKTNGSANRRNGQVLNKNKLALEGCDHSHKKFPEGFKTNTGQISIRNARVGGEEA